jgi:hypothetical protein
MTPALTTIEEGTARFLNAAPLLIVEMSGVVARVSIELPEVVDGEAPDANRLTWRGVIEGPFCEYASTLTAAVPLRKVGARPSSATESAALIFETAIPDPCFWTPQLPHRYRVKLELARDNIVLARAERWLGLRPLSVRARGLHFDGANWVLRAVHQTLLPGAELLQWREESLAMIVASPDDELCERASQLGVLLVAELSGSAKHIIAELQRLSRHAAVGMAIISSGEPLDASVRRAAGGIVLIQRVGATGSASAISEPPWRQALLVDASNPAIVEQVAAGSSLPVLVERTTAPCATLAAARRACDTLQADTAGNGTFAGYVLRKY